MKVRSLLIGYVAVLAALGGCTVYLAHATNKPTTAQKALTLDLHACLADIRQKDGIQSISINPAKSAIWSESDRHLAYLQFEGDDGQQWTAECVQESDGTVNTSSYQRDNVK